MVKKLAGEGVCASHKEAKEGLLELMGLTESIPTTPETSAGVLNFDTATLLSCAINHVYHQELEDDVHYDDYYFTPQELKRILSLHFSVYKDFIACSRNQKLEGNQGELLVWHDNIAEQMCNCIAHKNFGMYGSAIPKLPTPLTDHYGYQLAATLIPLI